MGELVHRDAYDRLRGSGGLVEFCELAAVRH